MTADTVWKRITMSRHSDQFSMYWLSRRARSSIDVSPRSPCTWASPVSPTGTRWRSS
ncbi:MAG: hypothetical protein ABSG81_16955 [Acidimicrobiales bacterium]